MCGWLRFQYDWSGFKWDGLLLCRQLCIIPSAFLLIISWTIVNFVGPLIPIFDVWFQYREECHCPSRRGNTVLKSRFFQCKFLMSKTLYHMQSTMASVCAITTLCSFICSNTSDYRNNHPRRIWTHRNNWTRHTRYRPCMIVPSHLLIDPRRNRLSVEM